MEGKPLARRLGGSLGALCLAVLAVVSSPTAALAADRAFSIRYQTNDTGDITIAGNTVMTCPAANPTCAAAQAGANANDNSYVMTYVDVDSDGTTFDSSTATVSIPAGATVLFAGLYWGADTSAGVGGVGAPDPAANNVVLFAPPGGSYATVTASQLDTSTSQPARYQGFADVTSTVLANGSGDYAVAQVQAGTGQDRYGGWSLVVAYHDNAMPPRNLTIFDGFQTVAAGNPDVAIPVSGFVTPTSGPVNTSLGFITYEGDRGLVGDTATLNATTLSDAANPPNNFFNSSISRFGVNVTTKNPNYVNQLGYDADLYDATGILPNGANSATIHVHTVGDTYFPGMISFATDLFAPIIQPSKTATDLNGGALEQGDILEYAITGSNTGQDGATGLTIDDQIPAGTTYVSNSLVIVSSPGGIAGPKTDVAGDDQAEFTGSNVVFRVGTGADATNGGLLAPGESFEVRFRVSIDAPAPDGETITNQATASFSAQTNPVFGFATASLELQVTVSSPDLVLTKTDSGSFIRGSTGTFTLTVTNQGSADTVGTVTVNDTLPADFVPTSASGTGWSCSIAGQDVTCTRSDPLAPSASYPVITIAVDVTQAAGNSVTNTASVSGGGDGTPGNNGASDTVGVTSSSDLGIVKSVSPTAPIAGDPAAFTLTVTNGGPSDATSVTVTDPLPSQLLSPVATPSQGSCSISSGTVTCALGSLAASGVATVSIDGTVDPSSGGGTLANSASVSATEPDPDPANNSDSINAPIGTSADLVMLKTLSPPIPIAGQAATYTLLVTNAGPSDDTNVIASDPLPSQLLSPSASPSQGTCLIALGTVTCSLGTIPALGSATVTITGTVDPTSFGQTMTNIASVTGDDPDPDTSNNSSTSSATVEQTVITLSKTGDPAAEAGTDVSFSITATVSGPQDATNVEVCDALPSHMTFVSAPGATFIGGEACWDFPTLATGSTTVLTLVAHIDADAPTGDETNTVTYTSNNAGTGTALAVVAVTAVSGVPFPVTG